MISDEIYSELTYKGNPVSITQIPGMRERTVLINGFSKAYAMTGWRLGYACGPEVILKTDAQNPSVCDHVCSYDEPVCGGRGAEKRR